MTELNPNLLLTNEQAQRQKEESADFDRGYARGYWHQPEEEPDNQEYMRGYNKGWDARSMDGN